MKISEISRRNTKVILKSILHDNNEMYKLLKQQFPCSNETEINVILLLKLEYSFTEVRIIIGLSEENIAEIHSEMKKLYPI